LAILGTKFGRRFSVLLRELLFKRANIYQFLVPTPLQFTGNQAVIGIHLVKLPMSACCLFC
jgi:hypothetical protein